MRKLAIFLGLFFVAITAQAAVSVSVAPTSLVISPTTQAANTEKAVFEFALSADDGETLSSVGITVNSSTANSADFSAVSIYKDDGDDSFDSGDTQAGTNTTVNVGSATSITTGSNNTLTAKFFVVVKTGASWSGTDSATVTLNANGITTSTVPGSPTSSAVTTATISAPDLNGPMLQTALAVNKDGSPGGIEAGDKVLLTFNEATNKGAITSANIASVLSLNNSHTWLDGAGSIEQASWNEAGAVLTITLSAGTNVPTIAVGDTIVVSGSVIQDANGNNASGTQTITGSFTISTSGGNDDDFGRTCDGGIINGKLYKASGGTTVYLAAGCKLRPFRGAAVFHARGHKFQNIITLSSLNGVEVSTKPALPAGGTLVKGSDKTVWFVTEDGKRKGFSSEKAFKRLGFNFGSVKIISDADLQELLTDSNIGETSEHPEGAVVKCTTSATVYMMKGNKRYAFSNPAPYLERGHTWDAIAVISCDAFTYQEGSNINQ
jgi:hypothetical protein